MTDIKRMHIVDVLVDGEVVASGVVVNITPSYTRVATERRDKPPVVDLWTASTGERYIDVHTGGRVSLQRKRTT
jgi:hypothetical protein